MARRKPSVAAPSSGPGPGTPRQTDSRAVQILLNVYGKQTGWEDGPPVDTEEILYAKSKGLMFDAVLCTHDEKVTRVAEVCARMTPQEAARGFLASLAGKRLEFRGALGSFAVFRHMPRHSYQPKDPPEAAHARCWCVVCGDMDSPLPDDLNWVSYHRFTQGCGYDSPLEAAFVMERFLEIDVPDPTSEDRRILQAVLDTAASLPATARPGELEKRVAKLLKTNKYVRQSLLETLGYCEILQSGQCPGYLNGFVPFEHCGYPPGKATEWSYPLRWWQGSDGVNAAAVKYWFPDLTT